jgi:hypothetical protein
VPLGREIVADVLGYVAMILDDEYAHCRAPNGPHPGGISAFPRLRANKSMRRRRNVKDTYKPKRGVQRKCEHFLTFL